MGLLFTSKVILLLLITIEIVQATNNPPDVIKDETQRILSKVVVERTESVKSNLHVCKENGKFCTTPGCIHAASRILSKMDSSVDPCDDFYQFSCGQFLENTKLSEEKIYVNTFSIVGDLLQEQLKTIITSPIDEEKDIEPFKMVKKLYLACMNETQIEDRGLLPLQEIYEKFGGFPVVLGDNWDENKWNFEQALKNVRDFGFSTDYIIDFSVDTDLKNSSRYLVNIDQTDFRLDIEYLLKGIENPIVKAYLNYQVDIAKMLGADKERAEKEMLEVLNFEIELAKISLTNDKRRNAEAFYNPSTVRELQEKYPYINWLQYLNDMLSPSTENEKLTENDVVLVYVPSFFNDLGELIKKTSKRTIANYLSFRMTDNAIKFLTDSLKTRQLQFNSAISGQEDKEPRWKECIDLTTSNLQIALSAAFVRKYFKPESKISALEMVNSIKQEFEEILKTVPWMGEKTRDAALTKIKAMATHIGHPDELMDDQKLRDFYKTVSIDENKLLESVLSIQKFDNDRDFNKLRKSVNKTDWVKHSKQAEVNAVYSSLENSIKFPAGILQGDFYSAERPVYMNYAAIGSIIGHEITHGFDDRGSQFDSEGNLVNWWDEETKKTYLEKARCIIEQYGNYTEPVTGMMLNGIKTQGENIADNGGLKEAYLAYQKYEKKNGAQAKLPGLNYTNNQMFWISAAQTWCSVYKPKTLQAIIIALNHPPSRFRVIGPISNSKEFAVDFKCPEGSKMNPINKCGVW